MPQKRSTKCARCGHPKSDTAAFFRKGEFADGTPRLFQICKKCAAEDAAKPEKRQAAKEWKARKRRAQGIPERKRGAAEFCPRGHSKAENLRPGRYDCAACNREDQLVRGRAAGAKPRQPVGSNWKCGHDPSVSMRFVKGKAKGCRDCHRERERARPFNYESWRRYYDSNKAALQSYQRAWRAVNRPADDSWRRLGLAKDYADLIHHDPCVYCGAPSQEIDHIVASSRGGSGAPENLAPICGSCNSSKQTKDVLQFMLYRLERAGQAR